MSPQVAFHLQQAWDWATDKGTVFILPLMEQAQLQPICNPLSAPKPHLPEMMDLALATVAQLFEH